MKKNSLAKPSMKVKHFYAWETTWLWNLLEQKVCLAIHYLYYCPAIVKFCCHFSKDFKYPARRGKVACRSRPPSHLRVTLQDWEEHVVQPQEDASILQRLQMVQRDGEKDAEGQADVVGLPMASSPCRSSAARTSKTGPTTVRDTGCSWQASRFRS